MASYPSLPILMTSDVQLEAGIQSDISTDGTLSTRAFFSGQPRRFTLRHVLTASELSTLLTFFDTNITTTVTISWESVSYDCLFLAAPQYQKIALSPARYQVEVLLREITD